MLAEPSKPEPVQKQRETVAQRGKPPSMLAFGAPERLGEAPESLRKNVPSRCAPSGFPINNLGFRGHFAQSTFQRQV